MEFLVNAVEFITIPAGIGEVHFRGTVAIDTPAHAHVCKLLHFIHFLDRTMASLALYFTGANVLGMAEIDMVGKIVDLGPFYGFRMLGIITACLGVIAGI